MKERSEELKQYLIDPETISFMSSFQAEAAKRFNKHLNDSIVLASLYESVYNMSNK